tara:strand:- start:1976 stop:2452 length:477 start_codon:yes stop_codon:yes gene_type:complete
MRKAMAFKKKKMKKISSPSVVLKERPSIINADLHITGNLEGIGEIQVDGRVDGSIHCESLTIGERGHVEGKVFVNSLRVFGTIKGSVHAQTVSIMETANIFGDVAHQKIEIRAGALVDGMYKYLKPEDFEKTYECFGDTRTPKPPNKTISRANASEMP